MDGVEGDGCVTRDELPTAVPQKHSNRKQNVTMLDKINYSLWCTTSANQLAGHKLWCPARKARRKNNDFGVSENMTPQSVLAWGGQERVRLYGSEVFLSN